MGLAIGGTHDVWGGGAVVAGVGGGARLAVGVGGARALPLVDHQVDGHLALQTADVAVAEVVAQLVYLRNNTAMYFLLLDKTGRRLLNCFSVLTSNCHVRRYDM